MALARRDLLVLLCNIKGERKFCSNGDELIFLQSQQELVDPCALSRLYNKDEYLLDKTAYGDGGECVVISGR